MIVVSNRQPYRHEYDGAYEYEEASDSAAEAQSSGTPSATSTQTDTGADGAPPSQTAGTVDRSITVDEPTGGLTAGLDPVLQETAGTWIAWGDGDADFDVTDEHNRVAVPPEEESYTLERIALSDEAVDSYYYGFSNRVLWPLCHGFTDLVENRSNDFEWYRTVNERFADAVSDHATADSVVWIQDYHFGLAPGMIRESVPQSTTIAQFWHIPWPPASTLQYCPAGVPILEGLLGNDLLGFHVDRYVEQFLDCVARYLPAATVDRTNRTVTYDGTTTRVVATPMGVDAESYDRTARSLSSSQLSSLFEEYDICEENVIGLGVDRLDYSKGIPERLAAVERFLERNPSWHGEFTFVQTATPSRTDIDVYEQYGDLVRSEAMRINQRFGTADWNPIVYTEDYISESDLCALYRRADLMVVSPLVDGMNLVAQEYVASSVDGDGTLVLSSGTGAHETLGSHAVTIDPTDIEGFANQLETAISMPSYERKRRMNTLRNRVFDGDLERWMETQFNWLRRVHDDARAGTTRQSRTDGRSRTDSAPARSSDSDSDARSESVSGSDSATGSESDTDSNSDGRSDPNTGPESDTESGSDGRSDSDAESDPNSESDLDPHERTSPV